MGLFVTGGNGEIIETGCSYLTLMTIFCVLPTMTNAVYGFFRGMGKMTVTLLGTFTQSSLRVIFVYILTPYLGLKGVAFACAVDWCCMLIFEVPYYIYFKKKNTIK